MRLGRHTLGRWNLLVLLGSALVTTALGLATQPLAAQTTTAAASAYRQGQFQRADDLLAGAAREGLLVDADALGVRGFARYQTGQYAAARRDFQAVLDRSQGQPVRMDRLERFAFYEAAKRAFCIIRTSDPGPYGCFILRKGVV